MSKVLIARIAGCLFSSTYNIAVKEGNEGQICLFRMEGA